MHPSIKQQVPPYGARHLPTPTHRDRHAGFFWHNHSYFTHGHPNHESLQGHHYRDNALWRDTKELVRIALSHFKLAKSSKQDLDIRNSVLCCGVINSELFQNQTIVSQKCLLSKSIHADIKSSIKEHVNIYKYNFDQGFHLELNQ